MRAVIIGAAGFLGSHLAEACLEHNIELVALDRPGCDQTHLNSLGITVHGVDVLNPETLEPYIREGDWIYHLAAYLGKAKVSRQAYLDLNVGSVVGVMELAIAKKAQKFIFPSSLAAMGPIGSPDKPLVESRECKPVTLYGQTKLMAEQEISRLAKDLIDCVVFRFPPFFGPRMNPITSSWILFDKLRAPSVTLIGDTMNYFPLCYVGNLVSAMITIPRLAPAGVQTYIIADGEPIKFHDILMMLREAFGINRKIIHLPRWLAYAVASSLESIGRLLHFTPLLTTDIVDGMTLSVYYYSMAAALSTGWKPPFSTKEGIMQTVASLRN